MSPMEDESNEESPGAYEQPTDEEIVQMRSATPEEAAAVDAMVLRKCSSRWQKVAFVVGQLLNEFEEAYEHLPLAYIQARMQELEDRGELEIAGDVWSMRHSEVRLATTPSEA